MKNPGDLLEDFSEVFLSSINGFIVRKKRGWALGPNGKREHDYDLLVQNVSAVFPELGNYILVECKDWDEEVGYDQIAKFIHKIHSRRCNAGIMIAMNNISHRIFNPTIKRAYDQDGISVIVLSANDIKKVLNKKINLTSLLRSEYEEVRFGTR